MNFRPIEEADYTAFRNLLIENVHSKITTEPVGLAMSGGIDSASIFFCLKELDVNFECYTFYQDGYESEDLISSRQYCKEFGISLTELKLPSDIDSIYNDIKKIIPYCGNKILKTKVETLRPLKYIFESCKTETLLNGLSADEYQPNQRKLNIMLCEKGEQSIVDAGKRISCDNQKDSMEVLGKQMASYYGIKWIDAYADKKIEDFFLQFKLIDIIRPHKNIVVKAFSDYFRRVGGHRKHSSYQINSRTNLFHDELLRSKYNTKCHRGIIGLYNQIAKDMKVG